MEAAVEELKNTVGQALEYVGSANHHLEELNAHIESLKEDIAIVEAEKTGDKAKDKDAEDTVRMARRMRRDLEKLTFPLQRYREEAANRLRREEIEAQKQLSQAQFAAATGANNVVKKSGSLKIGTIKLPIFEGEVEQWRGFKQLLTNLVDEDPEMASTKKWLLLREHLGGKALEIVQELPMAPETYTVAMDLLEQSYGSINKAVTTLHHRIQHMPVATMSSDSLRLTHAKIDSILRSLEQMGEDVVSNRFLRTVVISKFPKAVFMQLRVNDDMDLPKFRKKIAAYIVTNENSLDVLVEQPIVPTSNKEQNVKTNRFRGKGGAERSVPVAESSKGSNSTGNSDAAPPPKKRTRKCTFCAGEHFSDQCDVYKTIEQRKKKLGDRCNKCLRAAHPGKDCARQVKCAHCQEFTHNRALCPKGIPEAEKTCAVRDKKDESVKKIVKKREDAVPETEKAGYITLMLAVHRSLNEEKQVAARAIVDTASRRVLITKSLVDRLHLKENKNKTVQLYGVSNISASSKPSNTCKIYLHPADHKPLVIEAVVVDSIIDDVAAPSVAEFRQRYPQYSELEMPDEGNGRPVELLIGTRSLVSFLTLQNSVTISPSIQLLSTKFDWVILGGYEEAENIADSAIATLIIQSYDPIKLMCELDIVGLKGLEQSPNEEEAIALQKFYGTLEFLTDEERYEMGLPYRYDPLDLDDNFGLAWGRLVSLYKKLKGSPELLKAYDEQIKQQEATKVVEKVFGKPKRGKGVHYIAHQVVVRMDKSTPVRVVLDASAHTAGKRSLNDNILKGANWVDDMPSLLVRFRKKAVGVTADVSKAFHQLSIREADRDICRFLWLKDVSKPPSPDNLQVYRFCRVAFGITSSPFLLYATIKHHIRKHPHEYTDILETDFYADNLVTSIEPDVDFQKFYTKIKESFSSMSMNLTKWTSNSEVLRGLVPKDDRDEEILQTVLGMSWNVRTDVMGLQAKSNTFAAQVKFTKRRILKEAATVFDPLGWAMPVVLSARIFIRRVWERKLTWDENLTEELALEWQKLRVELCRASRVTLPRQMFTSASPNDESKWEVHVFADASIEAYAAVIFLKKKEEIAFVASKSRLSPKTKLSVPRLELIAAVIAARFSTYILKALKTEKQLRVTLWSDSKCMLSWLHTTKILPAYVQKSVAEIKSHGISSFKYVPSEKNPADIASRGSDLRTLEEMEWWKGPSWLKKEEDWPEQDELSTAEAADVALEVDEEEKSLLVKTNLLLKKFDPKVYEKTPFLLDPKKFLTFEALLKRSGFVLQAVNRIFQKRIRRKPIPVESEKTDYNFLRTVWLKWDQNRAYEEIPIARRPNVAYLRNISVFKDEQGVLRCSTRLQNSRESVATIHPILLVKDSPVTTLIVMSAHMNNYHAGTSHTLAAIRRAYWLPHGRQQVYKILNKHCSVCSQHRAKPYALPEMSPLPEFRIQATETPFRNTGLDIFGPITVLTPERQAVKGKRWVVIFTCLIIRAVHMEIIDDMTSEEFLRAFRRFAARRGYPERVVSDNAPQFTVVERRFVSVWHYISEKEDVVNYFAKKQMAWKFIPPYSPWMGGVYERLIKSVKLALEKVHSHFMVTEKQFIIAIVEVEAMLNSRPISYVDKSINTQIITPNNFLSVKFPAMPVNFDQQPDDQITQQWKAGEEYLKTYWKIWSEQYVRALRERVDSMQNEHLTTKREPKVGEIVLTIEPGTRRSSWKRAIIERLVPSEDSKIRAVQIRIGETTRMIRPINKLLPLDLITDLPNIDRMQLNAARNALVHQLPESVEDENSNSNEDN